MVWCLTPCRITWKISSNVRQRQRRPAVEALRRARVDAGLTISELAKRAGVSRDTISHAERGRHSLQGPTLSKIARALGRAPSELLAEEEKLAPKGESRSSPQASLNDALEDLRRTTARNEGFLAVRQALDGFCEAWEERLAEGDFDKAAIEEAGRTIKFFWPAVTAAADAEMVDRMRFGTYEEAAAHSKLFPAIRRFQALCDMVNSTYREKFLNAPTSNVYPFPQRKAS
jgi:transcriptional regulator with XRE-family HTH domain